MDYKQIAIYYPFAYINAINDVHVRTSCIKIRNSILELIIIPLVEKALILGFNYKHINRFTYKDGRLMWMDHYDMIDLMSVKEIILILKWFLESKNISFEERNIVIEMWHK
ncbi:MAG: hypothetical protein PHE54_05395 [Bacilli bacterium]|nr:hypothetical protein [Bacilli bacterium]